MNGDGKKYNLGSRFFQGDSRSQKKANNILGVTTGGESGSKKYRDEKLNTVEKYLKSQQYNHLLDWDASQADEDHVPLHKRKPKVIFPFAQVFSDRLASKLAGSSMFPKLKIEDDEEANYLMELVVKGGFIKPKILDAARLLAAYQAVFVRYKISEGALRLETHNPNHCYPVFKANGQLESVRIQYVYEDKNEQDKNGKYVQKWFRLDLTEMADILYDNPKYDDSYKTEPEFTEVQRAEHGLGYVQGEWISNGENDEKEPFLCQIKGFVDALNYNLSQTSQATAYGLDPQLVIKGMDEDEVESLIKSSSKAWLLGREGSAEYLESAGSGLESAKETRDDFFRRVQDIARIVMLDPEKMAANAQSGKAMEVLHAPLVELVNEIRPWLEKGIVSLVQKIMGTMILLNEQGFELQFQMPPGWKPKSLDIVAMWPPIFELTTQDKQQLVSLGIQVSNANIVARDTIGKWLASQGIDFGVEDWEAEKQKVDTQKTFGGFF